MGRFEEKELEEEVVRQNLVKFSDLVKRELDEFTVYACIGTFRGKSNFLKIENFKLLRYSTGNHGIFLKFLLSTVFFLIPNQRFANFRVDSSQSLNTLFEIVGDFGNFYLIFLKETDAPEVKSFLTLNDFQSQGRFFSSSAHFVYGIDTDDHRIEGTGVWEFISFGPKANTDLITVIDSAKQ